MKIDYKKIQNIYSLLIIVCIDEHVDASINIVFISYGGFHKRPKTFLSCKVFFSTLKHRKERSQHAYMIRKTSYQLTVSDAQVIIEACVFIFIFYYQCCFFFFFIGLKNTFLLDSTE